LIEVLNFLKKRYKLFLVTGGNKFFQMEKIKKAGLDFSYFSKIYVAGKSKKNIYKKIIDHYI
jgi:FMN phosphatase YigB (HAD superfamily)